LSGSFRVANYTPPESSALRNNESASATEAQRAEAEITSDQTAEMKQLVAKLRQEKRGAPPARNLPLRVVFPHFGPSIFLISELTAENQTPAVEFDFQRERKRGDR
jgi:hypothetical protein